MHVYIHTCFFLISFVHVPNFRLIFFDNEFFLFSHRYSPRALFYLESRLKLITEWAQQGQDVVKQYIEELKQVWAVE